TCRRHTARRSRASALSRPRIRGGTHHGNEREAVLIPFTITLAVVTVLGVALLRGLFLGYPRRRMKSAVLGAKEQAIIAAAADALFPANGPISLSGTQAGVVEYMHAHLLPLGPKQRALMKLLFWFVEHGPWLFGPRRTRFTRLGMEERARVLDDMSRS